MDKTVFFKKIWDKSKKIVLEILVIVFSITLSIWLSNLNDERKKRNEGVEFLKALNADLIKDSEILTQELVLFENYAKKLDTIKNSKLKTQKKELGISIVILFRNNVQFESYKNSGKLSNIKDVELRNDILYYYEQDNKILTTLNEKYNNLIEDTGYQIAKHKDFQEALSNKEIQKKIENLNLFVSLILQEGKSTDKLLKKIIGDIDKIN